MKHLIATICAVCLLAPAGAAFGAPHGGAMSGMSAGRGSTTMGSPMTGTASGRVATTTMSAPSPQRVGRPNQMCGSITAPNTPGAAANSPGSPFNPMGNAGTHYAGQQSQNQGNGQAAQYDVACSNQPGGAR